MSNWAPYHSSGHTPPHLAQTSLATPIHHNIPYLVKTLEEREFRDWKERMNTYVEVGQGLLLTNVPSDLEEGNEDTQIAIPLILITSILLVP